MRIPPNAKVLGLVMIIVALLTLHHFGMQYIKNALAAPANTEAVAE